jgi:hypothetical protein
MAGWLFDRQKERQTDTVTDTLTYTLTDSVYEVSFFCGTITLTLQNMNFVSQVFEARVSISRETCRLFMTMIDDLILCTDVQEYIPRIK